MKKNIAVSITAILLITCIIPAVGAIAHADQLPPPTPVDMILEESIFRRCSIRSFTTDPVSDQDLSTILWAAYGYVNSEKRTVHGINGVYGAHIYVLQKDAVYKYEPSNHTLLFYKTGDFRSHVAQYMAPVELGIVWDKNLSSDENTTGAEIGEIGQNIHFMANALDLGTVVNVGSTLSQIGLPSNEVAKIIMPLGHMEFPYKFVYLPLTLSLLPRVHYSEMPLTEAIEERTNATVWSGTLTNREQAQVIWSSYGYSYFIDKADFDFTYRINRHRTVPSAHGYYPLRMYTVTKSGVYRYFPNVYNPFVFMNNTNFPYPVMTFLKKVSGGDHRAEVAQASSQPALASAPLTIISVLDKEKTIPSGNEFNLSGPAYLWIWNYEAGASAYNVLLEATAWNLSASIIHPTDINALRSVLKLNENFEPLLVVPVGE